MIYTIAGQAITVLSSLALARIYSPEQFGIYGIVFSYVAIVGYMVCLNYDLAVPAPKQDSEAAALTYGALAIATATSFLLSLLFLALVATDQMKLGSLPDWSWLAVWALLITHGLGTLLQYWFVRQQRLSTIGEASLLQNGSRAVSQTGIGYLIAGHWLGLAIGEVAGRLFLIFRFGAAAWRELYAYRSFVTPSVIWQAVVKFKRFPLVLLPPMALDAALASISVLLINTLFGLAAVGQYWLMRRVLDMPVSFIAKTVGDAFHGKISEYARTDPAQIRRLILQLFAALLLLSTIAFAPLVIFGPSIFAMVFGEPWREAGLLAAVTVPAMVMNIATGPVTRIFAISHRVYLRYIFTGVTLLGYLIVFGLTWAYKLPIFWTALGLSLLYFISYSVYFATAYAAASHIPADEIEREEA